MNRYFLYLVLLNMMASTIIFVPKILLEYRFQGTVMAIILAIPIGTGFSFLFSRALSSLPEKGIPEILEQLKHKWIKTVILSILPIFWYSAGMITLAGFVDILNRFINPEEPKLLTLFIYLAALCLIIDLPTQRVMYLLEIVLYLNLPFIGFIIYEAFTSDYLGWDSMVEAATHLFKWPKWESIATATYTFSGYSNLIIFNRLFKNKLKFWNFITVFFLGAFNLFTTYFIPIGFHGVDGAHALLYPWILTADSMRLVYSPIERAIFLFLMLYMSITLMGVAVQWHVGLELVKGLFKEKNSPKIKWTIITLSFGGAIPAVLYLDTVLLFKLVGYWMILRLGVDIFIIVMAMILARGKAA